MFLASNVWFINQLGKWPKVTESVSGTRWKRQERRNGVFYQSYEHQYSFAITKLTNWLESRRNFSIKYARSCAKRFSDYYIWPLNGKNIRLLITLQQFTLSCYRMKRIIKKLINLYDWHCITSSFLKDISCWHIVNIWRYLGFGTKRNVDFLVHVLTFVDSITDISESFLFSNVWT